MTELQSLTHEAAAAVIDEIRQDNGGITDEEREGMRRNYPGALSALDSVRRILGASTRLLAQNLYNSEARFIYELIQNAEDNSYTRAQARGEQASLRFTCYEDVLNVDSNEDGFTEANVRAICSVGESTKTNIQGYIGEKGIGFKAVFIAANKVHIRSGPFSFAFQHEDDDSWLGMVTPTNLPQTTLPEGVHTRTSLTLREKADASSPVCKDLFNLDDTLLLFLHKLTKLEICVRMPVGQSGPVDFLRTYTLTRLSDRIIVHRATSSGPRTESTYLTIRRFVQNMPSNSLRRNISTAEVVLAFPLDGSDQPLCLDQFVHAYLPLEKAGFKFLIQSDFMTQASREGVPRNTWNERLLREIVRAFVAAIGTFVLKEELKYTWIRWLTSTAVPNDFWRQMQEDLHHKISECKVFCSWDDTTLHEPHLLRDVGPEYIASNGEPLLPDSPYVGTSCYTTTKYLSRRYSAADMPILRVLGVTKLCLKDFIDRVEIDFRTRETPRARSIPLTDRWHSQVALLLVEALQSTEVDLDRKTKIRKLPIVPLSSGAWVPALNASIFFPISSGARIPLDLPLSLVHEEASSDRTRKALYRMLGATECEATRVFPLIKQRYNAGGVTWNQSLEHLKFLYHHQASVPPYEDLVLLGPKWPVDCGLWIWPANSNLGWLYSAQASGGTYSPLKLLGPTFPAVLASKVNVVHEYYYRILSGWTQQGELSAVTWFDQFFKLPSRIQIAHRSEAGRMSPEFHHILENVSDRLLGVLKQNIATFDTDCDRSNWVEEIGKALVPCQDDDRHCSRSLSELYLPYVRLRDIVSRLQINEIGFPAELASTSDEGLASWSFLRRFGVGSTDDLNFWLYMLLGERKKDDGDISHSSMLEIYRELQKYTQEDEVEQIREWINVEMDGGIWVPEVIRTAAKVPSIVELDDCRWNGPEWLADKLRLSQFRDYRPLYGFFVNTLELKDACLADYLLYLRRIAREQMQTDALHRENILNIYKELSKDDYSQDHRIIRNWFTNDALVYHMPSQSWNHLSQCVWASDTVHLRAKVCLATDYRDHQHLFQKILGIEQPTLRMHLQSLHEKATSQPDKQDILAQIQNVCAFRPTAEQLAPTRDLRCFPVRLASGALQWVNSQSDFAIVDRRDFGKAMSGRIDVLDLTLEEVHTIEPFLVELGLASRYLSVAVREQTAVDGCHISNRLTEDFKRKSYAICRYAAHFGSERAIQDPAGMQATLDAVTAFTSNGISKTLSLTQWGHDLNVDLAQGYVHVDNNDGLKVYLPRSQQRREVCLARELPAALLKYFGATRVSRASELGAILSVSSIFAIDELLSQGGIIDLPGLQRPVVDDDTDSDNDHDVSIVGEHPTPESTQSRDTATPRTTVDNSPGPVPEASSSTPVGEGYRVPTGAYARTHARTATGIPHQANLYLKLLQFVVSGARASAYPPQQGSTSTVVAPTQETVDVHTALSTFTAYEAKFRMGAAGELLVFELLCSLGLPSFGEPNWQSTIRYRVNSHPDYRNLAPWSGYETTDIVYKDVEGVFTNILVDLNYFDADVWEGATPTYYIEVKTTTEHCATPFLCSQSQVNFMDEIRLTPGTRADKVYLIARVFNLGSRRTGLKFYMDPSTLRIQGELSFQVEKYAVTPTPIR